MGSQRGQASVEWIAALLVVVAVLAGAAVVVEMPWLPRALRCAVLAGCQGEERDLGRAYGEEVAILVRRYAPNIVYEPGTATLPVDFRECRRHWCADAPDRRRLEVNRPTRGDGQATVFTHVVDRRRSGGDLFIQYWLYYPDSTWVHPVVAKLTGGHHEDDWESYQLRIGRDGSVRSRASAHHGYAGHKSIVNNVSQIDVPYVHLPKQHGWTTANGWVRVSRGSHAGHIPFSPLDERRTAADGLRLVPIETLSAKDLTTDFEPAPPWEKEVYTDPHSTGT